MIPALNSIGTNPTEKDEIFSNLKTPEEIRKNRKEIQKERERDYNDYLKNLEKSINEVEGYDIKQKMINDEIARLNGISVGGSAMIHEFLEKNGSAPLKTAFTLAELMSRPELDYDVIAEIDPDRPKLPREVIEQVEIEIKYQGYIERQMSQIESFKKNERKKIPDDIDYDDVGSLRLEARQKLKAFRPANVGQASRISGVSPADVAVLLVYLK